MNIKKCKTCAFYEPLFNSCHLYFDEVYLGEGDFDVMPVSIRSVSKSECKYESKGRQLWEDNLFTNLRLK